MYNILHLHKKLCVPLFTIAQYYSNHTAAMRRLQSLLVLHYFIVPHNEDNKHRINESWLEFDVNMTHAFCKKTLYIHMILGVTCELHCHRCCCFI